MKHLIPLKQNKTESDTNRNHSEYCLRYASAQRCQAYHVSACGSGHGNRADQSADPSTSQVP